jgi:hypothetical protein
MLNDGIRNSKATDLSVIIVVRHKFKYCRTEPALDASIFHSNNFAVFQHCFMQEFFVKWFDEPHIKMPDLDPQFFKPLTSIGGDVAYVAYG